MEPGEVRSTLSKQAEKTSPTHIRRPNSGHPDCSDFSEVSEVPGTMSRKMRRNCLTRRPQNGSGPDATLGTHRIAFLLKKSESLTFGRFLWSGTIPNEPCGAFREPVCNKPCVPSAGTRPAGKLLRDARPEPGSGRPSVGGLRSDVQLVLLIKQSPQPLL